MYAGLRPSEPDVAVKFRLTSSLDLTGRGRCTGPRPLRDHNFCKGGRFTHCLPKPPIADGICAIELGGRYKTPDRATTREYDGRSLDSITVMTCATDDLRRHSSNRRITRANYQYVPLQDGLIVGEIEQKEIAFYTVTTDRVQLSALAALSQAPAEDAQLAEAVRAYLESELYAWRVLLRRPGEPPLEQRLQVISHAADRAVVEVVLSRGEGGPVVSRGRFELRGALDTSPPSASDIAVLPLDAGARRLADYPEVRVGWQLRRRTATRRRLYSQPLAEVILYPGTCPPPDRYVPPASP